MAKKKARRPRSTVSAADLPVVGPREPCPCGSGKKYKVCHGREAERASRRLVTRPFEGLPSECDWVALAEMVPAATTPLTIGGEFAELAQDRRVTLATLTPGSVPGLIRPNGNMLVGLHAIGGSSDRSRDIAEVLVRTLQAEPGSQITVGDQPGPGPRLQDVLDQDAPLDVTVHSTFDYWLEEGEELPEAQREALSKANGAIIPTARLAEVEAAYWAQVGEKTYLRWVMPQDEDRLLSALARLHDAKADDLGADTRLLGSFRSHGLMVPVWELAPGAQPDEVEEPAAALAVRIAEVLADERPLTADERHARAGLQTRQLTIR